MQVVRLKFPVKCSGLPTASFAHFIDIPARMPMQAPPVPIRIFSNVFFLFTCYTCMLAISSN